MSERKSPNSPLSSAEKLARLYDGLADDVRAGRVEIDEEEKQSAYLNGRDALEKALRRSSVQDSASAAPGNATSLKASESSAKAERVWSEVLWIKRLGYWFGIHPLGGTILFLTSCTLGPINASTNGRFWPLIVVVGLCADAFAVYLQLKHYDRSFPPFALKFAMAFLAAVFPSWLTPAFFATTAMIGGFFGPGEQQPHAAPGKNVPKHSQEAKISDLPTTEPPPPPLDDHSDSDLPHGRIM